MDFEAIKTAFYNWAFFVNPIETIFINENGSIPDNPFCTLYVQPVAFIGHDEYVNDNMGLVTYTGQREITLQAQYFGANAIQRGIDLLESLEMQTARDLLAVDGIVFVDRLTGVTDLSELVDTSFEFRSSVDILFRTASIRSEAGDIIESTELTSTIINPDGSTIERVEIIDVT